MSEVRAAGGKKRGKMVQQVHRRTFPWGSLAACALCGAGAFFAGDQAGYHRGLAAGASASSGNVLDHMDARAQKYSLRRALLAREKEPAPAPTPPSPPERDAFSFHESLKGAPSRTVIQTAPTVVAVKPPQKPVTPPSPAPAASTPTPAAAAAQPPVPAPAPVTAAVAPTPAPAAADIEDTPAPVAAPAPAVDKNMRALLASSPAVDDYALQAGAFPDKDTALRVFGELKAQGLQPSIVPSTVNGATWFRVRVGRFPERSDAEAGARVLASQSKLAAVVVRQ